MYSALDYRTFCTRRIGDVNIAMSCCDNIYGIIHDFSSAITNNRHCIGTPEELAKKCNIYLQTAKDTLAAHTQHGM